MQIVERPAAEKRKIHSSNEFELCYIRHQYFRRVKFNPTATDMEPYRRIVQYLAQRTFYTYMPLFHIVGMTLEDVQEVGMINLVNFIGLFEFSEERNVDALDDFRVIFFRKNGKRPSAAEVLSKNKANMTLFMKQRMEDLVRICRQKSKNIKGSRVDEYVPFYGEPEPPEDIRQLLVDNEAYGYYRCDLNLFKAYRKRAKPKDKNRFQFSGNWYIAVQLDHKNLTWDDLAGAGLDPHDNFHNMTPEQILTIRETEIGFDKCLKKYKNSTKEEKAKTILDFVEKNSENPMYQDEILTARKLLRNMGVINGRQASDLVGV